MILLFVNIHRISDIDPTRTLTLRRQFVSDLSRRFRDLKKEIIRVVDGLNVFGLRGSSPQTLAPILEPKQYEFLRDEQKINEFMEWLDEQVDRGVLEVIDSPVLTGKEPWTNKYIRSVYQRGMLKARSELNRLDSRMRQYNELTLADAFNLPFHADRAALLYTRVFNSMRGVVDWMKQEMSRQLSLGMAEGIGPREMARRLNNAIINAGGELPLNWTHGIRGIDRARLIARTETIYAHNSASLREYELAERTIGQEVKVQWWATMDERVRFHHAARHERIFEKEEALPLLGEPNCRCALLPYIEGVSKPPSKRALKWEKEIKGE